MVGLGRGLALHQLGAISARLHAGASCVRIVSATAFQRNFGACKLDGLSSPSGARAMSSEHKIVYTITDEAPMLATYAFLPIIKRFTEPYSIAVEKSDISVAARVLSHFPEKLKPEQVMVDELGALGELCKKPSANVIKLPNVSASIPQLIECIAELQKQGYAIPSFVADPKTAEEKDIASRYAKVLGSAVNPVLREGNSDRRAAKPVKENCMRNPKKLGAWTPDSKTSVAHMTGTQFTASLLHILVHKYKC